MPDLPRPGELIERIRRDASRSARRARNGVRHLTGIGRPAVARTPKDTVWAADKVQLWRYRSDQRSIATPLLFVHSLVSRSYVFDLAPGNSVVEAMLARGFDVYLVDWGVPDEVEASNTLETYVDGYLPDIVRAVTEVSGAPDVNLFGYCFGGLLALLYVAGHPGDPVRNLAVMATPVDFSRMGPMSSMLRSGHIDPVDLLDDTGNVPPEVVLNSFRLLAPTGDVSSYVNLWQHLWDDDYVLAHEVMTRWGRDHIPFPGACFLQVTDLFSRQDHLVSGRVPLGGRVVTLADITVPFLSIVAEHDHIVPPAGTGPLVDLVGSSDVEELRLPSGHVGVVIGRSAQRRNLPAMADWLERRSAPAPT
jgi:polyhydroxyalkanoate synthase